MPDLTATKSTVVDNIVVAIKGWIDSQDDESLKTFLRTNLKIDPMSMAELKADYESYMGGAVPENAYDQLLAELAEGEMVEKIVFGEPSNIAQPEITVDLRGKMFNLKKAEKYMYGWKLVDATANAPTYNVRIWTRKRVLWTKIDGNGSVSLASVPVGPEGGAPTAP